jgi:hypothetical protein
MPNTKVTISHDDIRRWAEQRRGRPSAVKGTGIIRIDFPGYSGAGKLQKADWDEFFQKFDESNLALVYQDRTAGGQKSNFNKLVGRETVDLATGQKVKPPRRRARPAKKTASQAPARRNRTSKRPATKKAPARRARSR